VVILNYCFICLIFGTTFLAIKIGIEAGAPPFFSAGMRFFAAGVIMMAVFKMRNYRLKTVLFSSSLVFNGFCLTFITFASLYWAEQFIPSGLAAVLSATGPMMVLLHQARENKQPIKKEQLAGMAAALIGVFLISSPGFSLSVSGMWVLACFMIILSEWFYGLGTVRAKMFTSKHPDISPFLSNAVQMFYGGIFLLAVSFLTGEQGKWLLLASYETVLSLLYLIIIGSIVGHGLYYWLVSKTNPVFPSTWLYISPLVALIAGYIILNEIMKPITLIGAFLILFGVFLTNRSTFYEYWKKGALFHRTASKNFD